jgi:hypothetical protein
VIGIIGNPRRDGLSSFEALISYCERNEKGEYRAAHTGMQNIHFPESAAAEMAALAFENKRCKDPLMHIILSWREMELPTDGQVDEAVKIALAELDLQGCQAVWAVHADTENRHVHIVANRIDPETYRAIQPAGRWTHRAIQRASRKIELAQGWDIETHGSYGITGDGEITEKNAQEPDAKLSKAALDAEANAAAKSAERICQEAAAPVIREAKSWGELHERLAEQGIAFERKGSGAILAVGEVMVKASKAGRDISLSKLEARLGKFQPRDEQTVIRRRESEPTGKVPEKARTDWERYTEAREKYFKEKKDAAAALEARQKKERSELRQAHGEERGKLFSRSWRGMGAVLNSKRSIIAAAQQGEKLNLRDRHSQERKELKKHFPHRFMNFKRWLDSEGGLESSASFRHPGSGAVLSGEYAAPRLADIRGFEPSAWNRGSVAYRMEGSAKAQFVDYGKKIVMAEQCGDAAVLAALQLANQKWGSAHISGTEEYKRQCVRLAARHGLTLSNPDLAEEVEKLTQRQRDKKQIFNLYADAVGAERYRVTVTDLSEGADVKAFIHDRKNGGYEGKPRYKVLNDIPKFSSYIHYGRNIIITPISDDRHHILVDDLTEEKLGQMKEDGYSPACVIESSPGNYQAVITVPSLEGDTSKDREEANRLTKELNLKYGDPKLSGSVHGHRLPPFPNQKPKHRRGDGTFPDTALTEANGGTCKKAAARLSCIRDEIQAAEEQIRLRDEAGKNRPADSGSYRDPNGAYWAHYRDIAGKFGGAEDYSRVDAMIGIRMRATGHTRGEVTEAIAGNAPAMRRENMTREAFTAKYGNRDWRRYADETAGNYVFGTRGAEQYGKALDYRPYYMRIEGRGAEEEHRVEKNKNRGR